MNAPTLKTKISCKVDSIKLITCITCKSTKKWAYTNNNSTFNQRFGVNLKTPFICLILQQISYFFSFFKLFNIKNKIKWNEDFDQRLENAPKCWSKYTTCLVRSFCIQSMILNRHHECHHLNTFWNGSHAISL